VNVGPDVEVLNPFIHLYIRGICNFRRRYALILFELHINISWLSIQKLLDSVGFLINCVDYVMLDYKVIGNYELGSVGGQP